MREFDAVLLATGYDFGAGKHGAWTPAGAVLRPSDRRGGIAGPFAQFLPDSVTKSLMNEDGVVHSGEESPHPRLYLVGFDDYVGRLAEMNRETEHIVKDILAKGYVVAGV